MTLKEFKHFADLYGGSLDRWPLRAGTDAAGLLESSDEARRILAEAAGLDALLDRAAPSVTDDSVRRVEAAIAARLDAPVPRAPAPWVPAPWVPALWVPSWAQSWALSPPPVRFWPTAGLLAVMAVAGFLTVSEGLVAAPANAAGALPDLLVSASYLRAVQ